MSKDISRKSVMVLVTVALVVSVLSTLFVLNAVYTYNPGGQEQSIIVNSGKLSVMVPETPPQAVATITVPEVNEGG